MQQQFEVPGAEFGAAGTVILKAKAEQVSPQFVVYMDQLKSDVEQAKTDAEALVAPASASLAGNSTTIEPELLVNKRSVDVYAPDGTAVSVVTRLLPGGGIAIDSNVDLTDHIAILR